MNQPENTTTKASLLDDDMVAYLDGELDEDRSTLIETRLANDPSLRSRLAQLQKTWDLLDTLPRPETTNGFTKSTMEMVVSEAKKEVQKKKKTVPQWMIAVGLISLLSLMGGWLTFAAINQQNLHPQRELVDRIEVIDRIDELLSLDSVEFLGKLYEEEVFIQAVTDYVPPGEVLAPDPDEQSRPVSFNADAKMTQVSTYGDTYEQRRDYVTSLSDDEYQELDRKLDLYLLQTEDEKARVEDFYRQIDGDPNSEQLFRVLEKYCEWLATLSVSRRSDFRDERDFDARIREIRFIQAEQESEVFGIRDANRIRVRRDSRIIYNWYREQTHFIRLRSDDFRKKVESKQSFTPIDVIDFVTATDSLEEVFPEESIVELRTKLSEHTNFILEYPTDENSIEEKRSLEDQRKLILQWVKVHVIGPQPTSSDLYAFFDQMPEEEKKELDGMSVANRLREIQRRFKSRRRN